MLVNLFVPMLLVGLVTSVHCVTMCGTMVLSYAIKGDNGGPFLKRMLPHFGYHAAKITSYVLVGMLLGAIGSAFNLGGIRGYVTLFAGTFMILMGLNMTGKFPWLRWITLRPPKFMTRALMSLRRKAKSDEAAGESDLATPIMFGALGGLMPCGPLQSAQIASAGAGSAAGGAIAMLGFGLGTMPLMLGFGAVSGMLGHKFKERMMAVAAIVIMIVGLVMLNRGAMLVGSPVTYETIKQYALGGPSTSAANTKFATGKDGVTEVKLTVSGSQFTPQALSIPAGKPVHLIVTRTDENPCSAQLAVPQLGVLQNLKGKGTTPVDIPAAKAGSYTLTCGMGMLSGRLDVGGGAAAGSPSRLPLLALVLAGVAAGAWAYTRRHGAQNPEPQRQTRSGKNGRREPVPAPVPTFMGFSPQEVVVVLGAVATAVFAGLFLGGMFR
jgi:sulfite exporter TauE/SafE